MIFLKHVQKNLKWKLQILKSGVTPFRGRCTPTERAPLPVETEMCRRISVDLYFCVISSFVFANIEFSYTYEGVHRCVVMIEGLH